MVFAGLREAIPTGHEIACPESAPPVTLSAAKPRRGMRVVKEVTTCHVECCQGAAGRHAGTARSANCRPERVCDATHNTTQPQRRVSTGILHEQRVNDTGYAAARSQRRVSGSRDASLVSYCSGRWLVKPAQHDKWRVPCPGAFRSHGMEVSAWRWQEETTRSSSPGVCDPRSCSTRVIGWARYGGRRPPRSRQAEQ
jgi:hypothetical protein